MGDHRGAWKRKVVITINTCTCGIPTLLHMLCSHMIIACRDRGVDVEAPVRMVRYYSVGSLLRTWTPRFEPFLDEDQWEPYSGSQYVADMSLL